MGIAVDKARDTGVGAVVVRNSDVTSAMGYYPYVAVMAGMVGLAITNSVPLMPPWGGTEVLLGNQAFAIGAPARDHPPLIFDSSTSAYNMGRMRSAAAGGEKLPPGVALDDTGEETDDAAAALEALAPPTHGRPPGRGPGHHVGGSDRDPRRTPFHHRGRRHAGTGAGRQGVSLYVQAVDPKAFLSYEEFLARVDRLIDQIHSNPPRSGVDRVRVPGESKAGFESEYRARGVPVPADLLERLRALCGDFGLAWPW